jgi:hypothetical protein
MFDEYFRLGKEIHEYFGYVEDWSVIPMEDARSLWWAVVDDTLVFYHSPLVMDVLKSGKFRTSYTFQIWEADEYTMISADTHTNGNKFLFVLDNAKHTVLAVEELKALDAWI